MTATSLSRIERLKRLEALLPTGRAPKDCPDVSQLLEILGEAYGADSNDKARRRALQRDLADLLKDGEIEVVNSKGKPLRYRRVPLAAPDEDAVLWAYTLRQVQDLVAGVVPKRQWERLWQRLLTDPDGPVLDETRLRIVPDTLRLQPVELDAKILRAVIEALVGRHALQVGYRKAGGERVDAELHPQALMQRGPVPYLFALKNAEPVPVRLYALHRMVSAKVRPQVPVRQAVGFDLDQAIAQGQADFGQGIFIDLDIRARGYLATLLEVCALAPGQTLTNEPEGSAFDCRVTARVPSTGQLLRWLLGAGDNLEVVAPLDLRRVVAAQARKMAALYQAPPAATPET